MRVAIVHDKLWQFGGGERVAVAMRQVWPQADLYTSTFDPDLVRRQGIGDVRATFLQRAPALGTAHHYFLPLYDRAFRGLDLEGYDLVVSSAAMFAKSVRPPPQVAHVCYCHTPIRFLWDLRASEIAELPRAAPIRAAVGAMAHWLRRVDRRAAGRVTDFVANSSHVAARIERYYGRSSTVIHPPVEVEHYTEDFERRDYVLVVARLFPYKRVDLVIEACNRLQLPLRIVGEGTDRDRLERIAGPTVEFLGWVPEADKPRLLGSARALVVPQIEDFGMATVEAIAAGTPVLALRDGGSLDIVDEGVSGAFFEEQSSEAVADALAAHDPSDYDRATLRAQAQRFAFGRFAAELEKHVGQVIGSPRVRRDTPH